MKIIMQITKYLLGFLVAGNEKNTNRNELLTNG